MTFYWLSKLASKQIWFADPIHGGWFGPLSGAGFIKSSLCLARTPAGKDNGRPHPHCQPTAAREDPALQVGIISYFLSILLIF